MSYRTLNGKLIKTPRVGYRAGGFGGLKDWEQTDPSVVGFESWKAKSKVKFRQMRKAS